MKRSIKMLSAVLAVLMLLGAVIACSESGNKGGNNNYEVTTFPVVNAPINDITTPVGADKDKVTMQAPVSFDVTTRVDAITTSYRENVSFTVTGTVPANGVITTAAELQAVLTNGSPSAHYTVAAAELDCTGLGWTGLKAFTGNIDFAGCVVKNASCPMILSMVGGTVKNLTVASSKYVYSEWDSQNDAPIISSHTARIYYAPVVSYMTGGVVENVVIESDVEVNTSILTKGCGIGGIVGWAQGSSLLIRNCSFKGTFYTASNAGYYGGIVGNFYGTSYTFNENAPESGAARIVNCTAYGTLTDAGGAVDSKMGGIAGGLNYGVISRCINYATINSGNSGQTAGIAAYVYENVGVVYCVNAGTIKVTRRGGGICAYSNGYGRYFYGCVNIGKVTSDNKLAAGILALANKTEHVIKCYIYNRAASSPVLNGKDKVVSFGNAPTNVGNLEIRECYSYGTIESLAEQYEKVFPGIFVFDAANQTVTFKNN